MNDDDGDGASDFAITLSWHSFSELVLYPWGIVLAVKPMTITRINLSWR